jgi:hypothetical protein
MAYPESDASPSGAEVGKLLAAIAQLLRHTHQLGPEAQLVLADLIEEMGRAIEHTEVPSSEIALLTESASQLVEAVREEPAPGVLEAARGRLENAAVAVETQAPTLAGLARRLAETLSNLGI